MSDTAVIVAIAIGIYLLLSLIATPLVTAVFALGTISDNRYFDEPSKGNLMDITKILAFVIAVLKSFAEKTTSTIDDKLLSLLIVLESSPALIAWLQSIISSTPDNALSHIDPSDPTLVAAIEQSPEALKWGRRHAPPAEGTPDGAQPVGILEIIAIAKMLLPYLPQIIAIIKAWKATFGEPATT